MEKNLSLNLKDAITYGNVDGLSLQNLFYVRNGWFPNCYMFTHSNRNGYHHFNVKELLEELISVYGNNTNFEHIKYVTFNFTTNEEEIGTCIYLGDEMNMYLRLETGISESYILYSNGSEEKLKELMEHITKFYVSPEEEKNNIYTIASSSMGYSLNKSSVKEVKDFDVKAQYNNDFEKEDEKIVKFIKEDDKSGLVILHGEKGTGKTTYIRHLINITPERKFVFVPSSLINLLGEPSFSSFLMTLANHVIILEDCENAIRDRNSGMSNSSAVSLLLNMTDGLLADDLGIKFICTFNEDIKNIDKALMRKGRLISKYEFKELELEKTKKLIAELYPDSETPEKAMTLADIYNLYEDSYEKRKTSII